MALTITDDCSECYACAAVCPNSAILMYWERPHIDPLLCTECVGFADDPQCEQVCVPGAIVFLEQPATF